MKISGPSFNALTGETTIVEIEFDGVLTEAQAIERERLLVATEFNAGILAQLAANDVRRGRALSDAFLHGIDTPLDEYKTPRERLRSIEAVQDELRAQLL